MPRVQIDLPENFVYSTELSVRVTDVNYAGHLGNTSIPLMLDEARARFFKHLGYNEADVEGTSSIMGDIAVEFRSEGFWGDTITVEVTVGDFSKHSYEVYYRLTNSSTGKLLAKAKTRLVCFDYKTRQVCAVPEAFKNKF